MRVEITVRIEGREVGKVEETLTGAAAEFEEQTLRVQQRVGRIVLENGF